MPVGQVFPCQDFTGSHTLESEPVASVRELVGARLRTLMTDAGLNQVEVAKRAGLDQGYISKLLKGQTNPTLKAIEKIANAMGISGERIMGADPTDVLRQTNVEGFSAVPLRIRPLAAGEPVVTEPDERDSVLAFREDLIKRRGYVRPICFRVGRREESMAPLIMPNDVVLLDQNQEVRSTPRSGQIYAVNFGPLTGDPGGAVKRVERDGRWLIIGSENPDKDRYPTRAHDVGDKSLLDILKGEVVWFGRYVGSGRGR